MSTEEKQNFLREKILEKGYDGNLFVQFLTEKKGDEGADVANWSMDDLKLVVNEFIKLHGGQVEEEVKKPEIKPETKPETKPEPKQEKKSKVSMFDVMSDPKAKKALHQNFQNQQKKPQEIKKTQNTQNVVNPQPLIPTQPKIQKPPNKPSSVSSVNNNMTGAESEYGVITPQIKNCKPLEETELSKFEKLEITVNQPEKKSDGFFSKTYVTYMITTQPALYKVRRRFADFTWLRSTLLNHFPYCVIPPIPKKTRIVGDNLSEFLNLKRGRGLEKFLDYLAKDPIIKNSQLFFDFLYIGAETDFNSKKKVYEKVKPITDVEGFRNKDSKVDIMITGEKENYVENLRDYTNININLLKKLNNSFKTLFEEINAVTSRMDEISSLWEQISKSSEKYYDNNMTCECFKQMVNLFSNWSKILKEQNTVVNVDFREHFKFLRKNYVSMKDMANIIESYKSNYTKASKNLISKIDDLFRKGDPSKWELDPHDKIEMNKILNNKKAAAPLMCKKDTVNVIGLKEMYGLVLNRIILEYERMRNLNAASNQFILNTNVKKLSDINGQFLVFSGDINSAIDSVIDNHSNDNKCKLKRIPLEE